MAKESLPTQVRDFINRQLSSVYVMFVLVECHFISSATININTVLIVELMVMALGETC
jgi:hypothetical protein